MALAGPDFYDDANVFATYLSKRRRPGNANDMLEKPIFDELAGQLSGLHILDLGCGDAGFGQEALTAGCRSYLGLEGSPRMVELAQANLAGTGAQVVQARMEIWPFPAEQFDLVTARLSLHYIADLDVLLAKVYGSLVDGGRLVCSIEHPVITSCDRAWLSGGQRQDWIVDDYFRGGQRITSWMGREVIKYHRTIEEYLIALQAVGFVVDALRESRPRRAWFADEGTYRRRQRIPLMLFLSATRRVDL